MSVAVSIRRFNYLVAVLLLSINTNAQSPQVTIITDKEPGVIALQGLNKLKKTLEAKHISFEQINNVQKPNGSLVIITGLAKGKGLAAGQIKSYRIIVPQSEEGL